MSNSSCRLSNGAVSVPGLLPRPMAQLANWGGVVRRQGGEGNVAFASHSRHLTANPLRAAIAMCEDSWEAWYPSGVQRIQDYAQLRTSHIVVSHIVVSHISTLLSLTLLGVSAKLLATFPPFGCRTALLSTFYVIALEINPFGFRYIQGRTILQRII